MISFDCEECQKRLKVKDELAGKKIKCPGCGHVQAAPQPVSPPVETLVESTVDPPTESPTSSKPIDLMAMAAKALALLSPARPLCDQAAALRNQRQDTGNIDKARALFQKALQADPKYWQAHYGLGEILLFNESNLTSSEVYQALQACRQAAELAQRQVEPTLQIAGVLAAKNLPKAVEFYLYALHVAERDPADTLYPKDWQAGLYWGFAIRAAEGGLNELATDAFRRALALSAEHWNYTVDPPTANACLEAARMFPQVRRYGSPPEQVPLPTLEPSDVPAKIEPEAKSDPVAIYQECKSNLKLYALLQLLVFPIVAVAIYAGSDSMRLYLFGEVIQGEVIELAHWGDVRYRFQVDDAWYSHSKPGEDKWATVPSQR